MDERLKNYCDITKIFIDNVASLQDCLVEANKTQKVLVELIELKAEFEETFGEINRKLEKFMADRRVTIKAILDKNSVKNITKEVIDDRVIALYTEEYEILKKQYDSSKLNADLCTDLRMVMFQRKDLLCHAIEYLRTQSDRESCIINSKKFIEHILGRQK